MKLKGLMKVMRTGCACFSISDQEKTYCEEYGGGVEGITQEPWYRDIKDRTVSRISTIGGGIYKVETCITLE